jgi:hypothetical protein
MLPQATPSTHEIDITIPSNTSTHSYDPSHFCLRQSLCSKSLARECSFAKPYLRERTQNTCTLCATIGHTMACYSATCNTCPVAIHTLSLSPPLFSCHTCKSYIHTCPSRHTYLTTHNNSPQQFVKTMYPCEDAYVHEHIKYVCPMFYESS